MTGLLTSRTTTIHTNITFWPVFVDMLTSVLMIFLLLNFLQTTLNVEDLEARATRQKEAEFIKAFEQEFRREIQEGTVSVRQRLNLLQLTFSDRILFQSGQYELQPVGEKVLERCAKIFGRVSGYEQIQVEGHTDDRPLERLGYPSNNWELSTGRAISVVQFFSKTAHLDARKLSANGYASYRPVATNATEAGRAKNRRIEIRIIFFAPRRGSDAPSRLK